MRSRIFITQNRAQHPQPPALEDGPHTFSEVSLSHPAIISQSSAIVRHVPQSQHLQHLDGSESQQTLAEEQGLPPVFIKLFMARQKDLQLSRNIELQLQRFSQLVFDQTLNKLQMREQGFGDDFEHGPEESTEGRAGFASFTRDSLVSALGSSGIRLRTAPDAPAEPA